MPKAANAEGGRDVSANPFKGGTIQFVELHSTDADFQRFIGLRTRRPERRDGMRVTIKTGMIADDGREEVLTARARLRHRLS